MRRSTVVLVVLALVAVVPAVVVGCHFRGYVAGFMPSAAAEMSDISLPPGFRITVYAADVPNARQMALGPPGVVFVGSRSEGKVYAVVDRNGKGQADAVHVLASGLREPSGVAFRDGALYVAVVNRILRFPDVARDLARPPKPEVVSDAFPSDGHHGWKFIAFGPDGRLYVPVGAPCNVCTPPTALHATITRIDLAGGKPEVIARGVRNSVGFDFDPATKDLWFTDNGRDNMGDDQPPDELNHLSRVGEHFGFPFCHGEAIKDPDHNAGRRAISSPRRPACSARTWRPSACASTPARCSPRSTAAASSSPSTAPGTAATPIGYRVTFVKIEGGRATSYEPFAAGWLKGSTASGRPADVLVMPDGALLVADDKAGRIYRISYSGGS